MRVPRAKHQYGTIELIRMVSLGDERKDTSMIERFRYFVTNPGYIVSSCSSAIATGVSVSTSVIRGAISSTVAALSSSNSTSSSSS